MNKAKGFGVKVSGIMDFMLLVMIMMVMTMMMKMTIMMVADLIQLMVDGVFVQMENDDGQWN